ncbi:MAG: protein kinase [Planctomycetes bacterium]|nr:protein kinase [Planctomycetota bacterium]
MKDPNPSRRRRAAEATVPVPPPSGFSIEPGTEIGPYRIERLLGSGGMGAVYLATDVALGRRAALKVLTEAADPELLSRFRREATETAKLRHPHIVEVDATGDYQGIPWIAMRHVEGPTLADRIDRGDLPLEEGLVAVRDVARALAHAHSLGRLHRDVKPSNVLFDRDGRALLADFGLVRAPDAWTRLTQTGAIVGTPAYMSPEQAAGTAPLDARSDVYSLGATLYEILVGRPPHQGENIEELLASVLAREPERPRRIDPRVPAAVEAIAMTALARDPRSRYLTAAAFADDIDRYLAGKKVLARPFGLAARARRAARRWRLYLVQAAAAVVLSAVVLGVLAGLGEPAGEKDPAPPEAGEPAPDPGEPQPAAPPGPGGGPAHAPRLQDPARLAREGEARELYRRAIDRLERDHRFAEALDDFLGLKTVNVAFDDIGLHLGQVYLFLGDLESAVPILGFETVSGTDPGRARVLLALARKTSGSDEVDATELREGVAAVGGVSPPFEGHRSDRDLAILALAVRHLRAGNAERAVGLLRLLEILAPSDPTCRVRLAEAKAAAGHPDVARSILSRAVEAFPASADVRAALARDLAGAGDFSGAERLLSEALDLAPDRIDLLYLRAEARTDSGRASEALEDLAEIESRHGSSVGLHRRRLRVFEKLGATAEVAAERERLAVLRDERKTGIERGRTELGDHLAADRFEDALAAARRVLAIDGAAADTVYEALRHALRGGTAESLDWAIAVFSVEAARDPSPQLSFLARAFAQEARGQYLAALRDYERAEILDPEVSRMDLYYAGCHALAGEKSLPLAHAEAFLKRNRELAGLVRQDPDLASLAGDPAFEALLRRFGR